MGFNGGFHCQWSLLTLKTDVLRSASNSVANGPARTLEKSAMAISDNGVEYSEVFGNINEFPFILFLKFPIQINPRPIPN